MGLLNFVKDAGEKVWNAIAGNHTERASSSRNISRNWVCPAQITSILMSRMDKAMVTGENISQELKEKILVAIGNVAGISGVEDKITSVAAAANTAESPAIADAKPASRFYMVVAGDTLSKIAKSQYGNANDYMKIFTANKPMLSDSDKIYPGQTLIILQ